jgi:hypothetical protein
MVFHQKSLGPLILSGALISLRQFLGWSGSLPPMPPVPGKTLLVCGIEALIETMEPQSAHEYLAQRVRPLIISLQTTWTDCGVVFAFSSHRNAFEESAAGEEVLFRRRDRKIIHLSDGLWDGSAIGGMKRLVGQDPGSEEESVAGYYVARIS